MATMQKMWSIMLCFAFCIDYMLCWNNILLLFFEFSIMIFFNYFRLTEDLLIGD
jgi:hypothetical protein